MSLTDHDNVFVHPLLQKVCAKNNIKSILGCEMRLVDDIKDNQRAKGHLTVLAKSYEGYVNLMKLLTMAWSDGCFYYKPTIDKRMLFESSNGLIVLSGCPSGSLSRKILDNDTAGAMKLVSEFKNVFGDDYYLEVMAHDMDETDVIAPMIRALSNKYDIKCVLTNDEHFLEKGQERLQKILWCIRDRETLRNHKMETLPTLYYMSDDDMLTQVNRNLGKFFSSSEISEMFNNQERIASDCNTTIPKAEFLKYGVADPYAELRSKAIDGLNIKGLIDNKEYTDRIEKELDLVNIKNFSNYFLVVADIVNWAKDNSILVGPSRGCFLPENKVYTKNKRWVDISKITVGSRVKCHDGEFRKVVNKFEYPVNEECVEIEILDNENIYNKSSKIIKCTADHLLMGESGWIKAGDLSIGNVLDGPRITVNEWIECRCSDCGCESTVRFKKLYNSATKYRDTESCEWVCKKCMNIRMAKSPEGIENRRKAGMYWSTNEGRKKMSDIVLNHPNKEEYDRKRAEGSRKYIAKWRLEHPGKRSPAMEAMWGPGGVVDRDPSIIHRMLCKRVDGGYKHGDFYSEKNNATIHYESSYELQALKILETDPEVISFKRGPVLKWFDPVDKKDYTYAVDFEFAKCDGKSIMLETKANWVFDRYPSWHDDRKIAIDMEINDGNYSDYLIWTQDKLFVKNDLKHKKYTVIGKKYFKYIGKVYDIEVEDAHNYCVEGVTAHNSVACSLLAYCIGITEVDPIRFGLPMERFMSEDRVDPPDIDVDFQDSRRQEVIDYMSERFKSSNVAQLATVVKFKGKNTLGELGKVFEIPPSEIKAVQNTLIYRCLPAGTDVIIDGGIPPKKIEDVKIGDKVLSYNFDNGNKESDVVSNVWTTIVDGIRHFKTSNNNELICSKDHKIYTTNRGWLKASDINIGDKFIQYRYFGLSNRLRLGKKCEDFLGEKKAKRYKDKTSKSHKGNKPYNAGKTLKEIHGEYSDIVKYLGGKAAEGNIPWNKGLTKETDQRLFDISNLIKDLWKDPDYAIRCLSAKMASVSPPNGEEMELMDLIDNICHGEFRYNGDARLGVFIANHVPDFVNVNGKKKLIEYNGCYWHGCKRCGYEEFNFNNGKDAKKIKDYKDLGWDCLTVWGHELRNKKKLEKKIETFLYNPNVEIVEVIDVSNNWYLKDKEGVWDLPRRDGLYSIWHDKGAFCIKKCNDIIFMSLSSDEANKRYDELLTDQTMMMYDIEVEKNHNFFAYGILLSNSSADARSSATIEDTFKMFPVAQKVAEQYPDILDAKYFEGQIRHTSVHAAGIVVSDHPLWESTAIMRRNGTNVAMLTGESHSVLGLLKMDILGLDYLSILKDLCEQTGIDHFSLYSLPIDDKEVFNVFNGSTVGIFQFNEASTYSVGKQLGVSTFNDIVLATSLSRPGPLHCVAGNMVVYDCDKNKLVRMDVAAVNGIKNTLSLYPDGSIKPAKVKGIFSTGKQQVYSLRLKPRQHKSELFEIFDKEKCPSILASSEHRFLSSGRNSGWIMLKDILPGDIIQTSYMDVWTGNEEAVEYEVDSITPSDIVDTYDMEIEETHNYVVNGFITHNSGNTQLITETKRAGSIKRWNLDIMNEITKDTYGYVVFQEQVIRIMHEIGGMEWKDVSAIRSAMSKSLGDEYFNTFRDKFVTGSGKQYGVSPDYANTLFDHTSTFGCVAGNTRIFTGGKRRDSNNFSTIKELFKKQNDGEKVLVPSVDLVTGKVIMREPVSIVYSGIKPTYFIRTARAGHSRTRVIRCTLDHKFLSEDGNWKRLGDLKVGEKIYIANEYGSNDYRHYSTPIKDKEKMYKKIKRADGNIWNKGLSVSDNRVFKYVSRSLDSRSKNQSLNNWGYGERSIARDGHVCQSKFEAKFENWMIDNDITHAPHPRVNGTIRVADYAIGECYVELDGMQPKRTAEYWNEKYNEDLSRTVIVYPKDDFDKIKDRIFAVSDPIPPVRGRAMVFEEFVGKDYACDEDTYDIIMPPEQPNFVADGFVVHNSWAFNKAHAVGYSLISYWTAYFKAHYPRVFYKVLCDHAKSTEKLREYLREYKEKGYGNVLPPKINKSGMMWSVEGNDLRAGLTTLLPEGASSVICGIYPITSMNDLQERAPRRKVNSRIISMIEQYDMFSDDDSLDPFGLYAFAERLSYTPRNAKIGDLGYNFEGRTVTIAGVLNEQINLKSISELKATQKLKDWSKRFNEDAGEEWAIITLVDDSGGVMHCHVKNYLYPKYKDMLWSKIVGEDVLIVSGYVPGSTNYMIVKDIQEWNDRKAVDAKCYKCSLIENDFCPPSGNPEAKIVFVGMCPGRDEIAQKKPFVGKAGRLLNDILDELHVDREKDLWVTNSALCRPVDGDKNVDPNELELDCCSERLKAEIKIANPKVVVTFGKVAYFAVTGDNPKSITEIAGTKIAMESYILIPAIHPAAALRPENEKYIPIIKDCIKQAIEEVGLFA